MNAAGWACERAFTPLPDFEDALKQHGLPLYSLETFTPLCQFDVLGFSLQYEICYTNVLMMLDSGWIALHAEDRGPDDTLVIAGGPGAQNPELLGALYRSVRDRRRRAEPAGRLRPVEVDERLRRCLARTSWPGSRQPSTGRTSRGFMSRIYREDGTILEIRRCRDDVPEEIKPCVIRDLESIPLPTRPIVPFVETTHDRIAIEIMRGLPLAVPVLSEHRHQAAAAPSHRRDDRPGRARKLLRHRIRRDQPAVALHERLSRF